MSDDRQRIRNFARVAGLLALARRRNLCEWTKVFRAGAAMNALQELNASGAINLGTYKILDAWILWGKEDAQKKLSRAKGLGRAWWRPKQHGQAGTSSGKVQGKARVDAKARSGASQKARGTRTGKKVQRARQLQPAKVPGLRRNVSKPGKAQSPLRRMFKMKASSNLASPRAVAAAISRIRPRAGRK